MITSDIRLASDVLGKGGYALNPRGSFYTSENIREELNMRLLMEDLRNSGINTGEPSAFSHADREAFANQLDRFLSKNTVGTKRQV